ncbi:hypothetical protein [uncultured Roseivirga sp.]|uniref:hypothetical protein n=1 Tax=uncultured Roseivirga sp. TaxID=543088 RepID=UPI0030D8EABE|tara:strand:- start:256378 stop:256875 length:498 start_codon:yes stop_codon:yes gene_type:complete
MNFIKGTLSLFLMTTSLLSLGQTINYEQRAMEHFFDSIFYSEYPKASDIQFSGLTSERVSQFGFLNPCFGEGRIPEIYTKLETAARNKQLVKPSRVDLSEFDEIIFKKRRAKSRLKLELAQAVAVDGYYYVELDITVRVHSLDAYYLKINEVGDLVDWCKTAIIY